ncbi:MAG: carbon storage regulator CsrA [Clostridiaceae bacterium]|nr:carbon storage regulator CsrA [Clostridiaceae bacterium]
MLVVSRKNGESILIGDNIEIVVIKTEDGTVKLGINAPKEITILRNELLTQVKDENIKASQMNSSLLGKLKK